jgi:hypothetical protein
MKLSDTTISVLKNFTAINEGIIFQPGSTQKTIDPQMTVMAFAEFEESFPKKAPIVELAKFIQNIEAMTDHDIAFETNAIVLSNMAKTMQYSCLYGSEKVIKAPPDKTLPLDDAKNALTLTKEQISLLLKFASINNLPYISFYGDEKGTNAEVWDPEASGPKVESPHFTIKLDTNSHSTSWKENFKTERLQKMLSGSYNVKFLPGHCGIFENASIKVKYIIAAEKK